MPSSFCAVRTAKLCAAADLITFPVQTIFISHLLIDFPASTSTIYSLCSSHPGPSKLWIWSCHSSAPSPPMASPVPQGKTKGLTLGSCEWRQGLAHFFSVKGQAVNIYVYSSAEDTFIDFKRERERERNIDLRKKRGPVASWNAPIGDWTHNLLAHGMMLPLTEPPGQVQIVNIFVFVGQRSLATAYLCNGSKHSQLQMSGHGRSCVPTKPYLQKQANGWVWLMGCSVPTSAPGVLAFGPLGPYDFYSVLCASPTDLYKLWFGPCIGYLDCSI